MLSVLLRELRIVLRSSATVINPLAFFFIAITLFAVGGPEQGDRAPYAGAVLWVLVLLTVMLSLDGLFRRDYDNGMLEQVVISPQPLFLIVTGRIAAQWLVTGGIFVLLAPLLGLMLGLEWGHTGVLLLSLLLGTPALSFLGAMGAALTVGFSRGGVLLGLLILPLFLPTMIFGSSLIVDQVNGVGGVSQLYWLAFISMVAITIGPFATAAGLKISLQMQ